MCIPSVRTPWVRLIKVNHILIHSPCTYSNQSCSSTAPPPPPPPNPNPIPQPPPNNNNTNNNTYTCIITHCIISYLSIYHHTLYHFRPVPLSSCLISFLTYHFIITTCAISDLSLYHHMHLISFPTCPYIITHCIISDLSLYYRTLYHFRPVSTISPISVHTDSVMSLDKPTAVITWPFPLEEAMEILQGSAQHTDPTRP